MPESNADSGAVGSGTTAPRESILQEAQRLIHGERAANYGHPRDNFKNIADLWTAYLGWEIKPMDVGLMMVLLKVARLETGNYHRDSVADIAGYAGTLERIFEEPVFKHGGHYPVVVDLDEPVSSEPAGQDGPLAQWEIELMADVKPKPRVWKSLTNLQGTSVEVEDKYGNRWKIINRWFHVQIRGNPNWSERNRNTPISKWDSFGPFTEVVA